jgi:aryl-alcohol dehydrogenase-like predicted oxidoreductase
MFLYDRLNDTQSFKGGISEVTFAIVDIVIYNPLAGGLFSGKYKSQDIPAEGRYSDSSSTVSRSVRPCFSTTGSMILRASKVASLK